jgi:hypothetical protein
MSFSFDERTAKDLAFVGTLPVDQLKSFCTIALDFIKSGANPKLFERAAQQTRQSPEVIENSVIGLVQIFIDSTKSKIGEGKFMLAASQLPVSDEAKAELCKCYLANRKAISKGMEGLSMSLPEYKHLDWRLDVEMGSRTLHRQVQPTFVLRLDTEDPGV